MTKIEELERVMETEVEVGEALLQLLSRKQRSIVGIQGDMLSSLAVEEQKLLKPLHELESERMRLAAELAGAASVPVTEETRQVSIDELLECLDAADAVRISTMAARLRTVVERLLHMNDQNRVLLQRSLRFVQDTLRLVTDDHTRQLVDHRI
ncbi:MAG: flagellar protein FlgN [Bacteroidetes bacterium]|nr:flagellar protein FlgN [Bacteroidota bacterium]